MNQVHVAFPDLDRPWTVGAEDCRLYSEGFEHDVRLDIDGDWATDEQKRAYANALADRLNDRTMDGFERSSAAEAVTVLLRALGWKEGGLAAAALEIVKQRDSYRDETYALGARITSMDEQLDRLREQDALHTEARGMMGQEIESLKVRLSEAVAERDEASAEYLRRHVDAGNNMERALIAEAKLRDVDAYAEQKP